MEPNDLLAGSTWTPWNFAPPSERLARFEAEARLRLRPVVDGLLLYDRIVIPTQDFLELYALVSLFGPVAIRELLSAGDLLFARYPGSLAYWSNSGRLGGLSIGDGNERPVCFRPSEEALPSVLESLQASLHNPRWADEVGKSDFENIVLSHTYPVERMELEEYAMNAAYRDWHSITGSEWQATPEVEARAETGDVRAEVSLCDLPQWQTQRLSPDQELLWLAQSNMELAFAATFITKDVQTRTPMHHALRSYAPEPPAERIDAFLQVLPIPHVPDLTSRMLAMDADTRSLELCRLVGIKHTPSGDVFRAWFHREFETNPNGAFAQYREILTKEKRILNIGSSLVNPLIANGIGLGISLGFPGIVGSIASAGTSFGAGALGERILRFVQGRMRSYYIEQIRDVLEATPTPMNVIRPH